MGELHDFTCDACIRNVGDTFFRRPRMDRNVDCRDGLFERAQNGEACVASSIAIPGGRCPLGV